MQQKASAEPVKTRRTTRKNFHLNAILSLVTGMTLSREGSAGPHRLVAFMLEAEAGESITMENAETVKKCLEEQLPFLKDISFDALHQIMKMDPSPDNPYLSVWREMQALRYGEEHPVLPVSRWQACQMKKKQAASGAG